jgi:succinate dehydrogenase / fumarate reductase iron-sulfur subunit
MEMRFRIYRFDPETDAEPRYQAYSVSAEPQERLLDCLNRIRWEQDGTLAYRMSCAHGICGSDAMKINGRCGMVCQKLVKDYQGAEVTLEPLPTFRVLKDLIVDLEPFFRRIEFVRPYLAPSSEPPERERLQAQAEKKRVDEVIRCILCACCSAQCPVENENPEFLGPAPLVWAFRYIFDSRDGQTAERLKLIDSPNGVWPCVNHYECTRVCPKAIPVTRCINQLKRKIRAEIHGEGR